MRLTVAKLMTVAMLAMVCCTVSNSFAGATTSGHPTLSQLEADISATLHSGHVPNFATTIPTLTGAPLTNEGRFPVACDPSNRDGAFPANAYQSCAFGDRKTKRTIMVFGDSDATMWIPTFRTLGTELHWKVVIIANAGCSPWSFGTNADGSHCRKFVDDEIALANEMHPAVVIPMGDKVAWRGTKLASVRFMDNQIQRTLTGLHASRSHVILFEPIPKFDHGYTAWTPQICLHAFRSNLGPCEKVIYNDELTSTASQALFNVALKDHLPIINTRELFCSGTDCALYVSTNAGTLLVYRDASHINLYYANWISTAVESLVRPFLR